ncbi:hypothetical protein [Kribbella sp.]|uniref:hypothetical protein n=1 Tax=Kribbella sp. TaxID=1871183 RepID=UPI002D6BC4E4|nr:hypothetical protein [Kribbella sp.]HZX05069.1 hypothetical protein [Kribbella sp.]
MDAVARWVSGLGVFAVIAVVFGVVSIVDDHQRRAVGRDLLASGTRTVATDVVVHVTTGRSGDYLNTVDVVFDGRRLSLSDNVGDAEGNDVGEHAPNAGTRYAAPLPVVYKRDDPGRLLAVADAEEFAAYPNVSGFAAGAIALGGTVMIGLGVAWLVAGRRSARARHLAGS